MEDNAQSSFWEFLVSFISYTPLLIVDATIKERKCFDTNIAAHS